MQLLLFVFLFVCFAFVEICCDNAKLSNRLCRFYIVFVIVARFAVRSWFRSMKAKVFGM